MDLATQETFKKLVDETGKVNELTGYIKIINLLMGLVEKNILIGNKEDVKILRNLLFLTCMHMKTGGFTNKEVLETLQQKVVTA